MTDEPSAPRLDPERRQRLARWVIAALLAGLVLVAAIVGSSRSPGSGGAPEPDTTVADGAAGGGERTRPADRDERGSGREPRAKRGAHRCLPTPRLHRTRRYAERRSGSVAFAFVDECGRVVGLHRNRVYVSASEIKAMLLVAYLREEAADRDLGGDERSLLARMIELSDNDAADAAFAMVGEAGLVELADDAGMRHFVASPAWGGSGITAADQASFLAHLERYVPERHERYALRVLARVSDGQSWGVPEVKPRHWRIHFKGGWYPVAGAGWRVNQVATLRRGSRDLAVAVLTDGDPTFEYGQETVRGIAQRLLVGY